MVAAMSDWALIVEGVPGDLHGSSELSIRTMWTDPRE